MQHSLTALAVIATFTSAPDLRADVRVEIKKLVPEASAMKQADFEKLARSAAPNPEDIEENSLTLMLLQVEMTPDDSAAQRKEFRYQQPPKPDELADEIYRIASRAGKRVVLKGPVTFLSANRITNVTAEVEGDQATGTVSFKAPNLYEGQVQYTARRQDDAWRITAWRMPAHDIHLVYDDETRRWIRKDSQPDGFITATGDYKLFDGALKVLVAVEAEGVNYRLKHPRPNGITSNIGPTHPIIKKGTPWFIYPESEAKVWIFNGADQLRRYLFTEDATDIANSPEVVKTAPEAVWKRLPEDFKRRYR